MTNIDFDIIDDSREGVEEEEWEDDILYDVIEEDGERKIVMIDDSFDEAIIESDHSVSLEKTK